MHELIELVDWANRGAFSLKSLIYYLIDLFIWMLGFIIIYIVPLKLLEITLDQPSLESFPLWLEMLYVAIALLVAMIVAILLTNRIASQFMSKEAVIEIINKNFLITSPFYSLIIKDIDRIYRKKDK